jgi:hypothetical protein
VIHGTWPPGSSCGPESAWCCSTWTPPASTDPPTTSATSSGSSERRCRSTRGLPEHSRRWLATFRAAYPAESLGMSWRNAVLLPGRHAGPQDVHARPARSDRGPRLAARLAGPAHARSKPP